METTAHRAIAIVGVGATLPDAPNAPAFWSNVKNGRYSIADVDPARWDPNAYYDEDHNAPDKTYSKIGGWVREFVWDPIRWHLPIPPRVVESMDDVQKWAVACTREALQDYGYPKRPLNTDRTAVILGNAMAGERHYLTSLRISFPEYARELAQTESFAQLPAELRNAITAQLRERIGRSLPPITEDSMPGELANCMAGRVANVFNLHGPNYVCDAACASAMAAISAAMEGLIENDFDVAITGGLDRNMGAPTFVKFCKIGALSATGTRPYAEGADGFVMGEGAALFVLKRLADAEKAGDKIYAVIRGMGGSSDGKGKGITAPNPLGQKLCVQRAWENAGLSPATATYFEGHGTSTRVGDVVETGSLAEVLASYHLPANSIGLGSVKSNIGHLKGAAGAAGLLKTALALHEKVLPPSLNCATPNPGIDFASMPLFVNTKLRPWEAPKDGVRRAGVSAFGFGGTNFHAVLEEYVPGRIKANGKARVQVSMPPPPVPAVTAPKAPLRGALVIGANSIAELTERLRAAVKNAEAGDAPAPTAPRQVDLQARERIAIDYGNAKELAEKGAKALKALAANQPAMWKALRAAGVFKGSGPAPKVAFLYTGQGSQYVNMLTELRDAEPIVAATFAEADRVMTPLLGKPLSDFIFVRQADPAAVKRAEMDLRQTAITQPAVLATDLSLTRLLAAFGIEPDMTMGHSLGEYGALVAAGGLPFEDSLEAVSARGREMTKVSVEDNGKMAAVMAPIEEIERILKTVDGYVVLANVNSTKQAVIGGTTPGVEKAVAAFQAAGFEAIPLPVSHAFHTRIVAPASEPLRRMMHRLRVESPQLPIVTNVTGEFYPRGEGVREQILDILAQQVAAPVQFTKGLQTLFNAGARVFVEVGPKKALFGFVEDVLGGQPDVLALFTNHPKLGDLVAFNQALCGLYASGLGRGVVEETPVAKETPVTKVTPVAVTPVAPSPAAPAAMTGDRYHELGKLFSDFLERASQLYGHGGARPALNPVQISGAALGLPGTERVFDDHNLSRLLHGEQFIDAIPVRIRRAMVDKNITRLVKNDNGNASFELIHNPAEVIRLAGRGGAFHLGEEFGIPADRLAALDRCTQLAIAVGLDALRDAGIPLVQHYKTTSKGTQLPDRWGLPESMRDDTGIIFASCFPGYDAFADDLNRHHEDQARRQQLETLRDLRARANSSPALIPELDRRIAELEAVLARDPFVLDRRFVFKILAMGHSQFAEFIGARGPNTQINSACASTTQAVSLAEDWIHSGRCRRVLIVAADDVTSDRLLEWIGSGFLASGAAATDEIVEEAALPFDRRRHGTILGMGAAGLVVESEEAARERGIRPICQVLAATTANSAFHGTRLDVSHICQVMENLVRQAEERSGVSRQQMASRMVFVSHETFTPARGGSAAAEIHALRHVFGEHAAQIVIANTKGYTGHAMGAGIEDVLAVKALESGVVPPVANFKEPDPDLGALNLSRGGSYPVEFALRLGAGFGSQISMSLLRLVPNPSGVRTVPTGPTYSARIENPAVWSQWLTQNAGGATLEVVHRTLRVKDGAAKDAGVVPVPKVAEPAPKPAAPASPPIARPAPAPAPASDPVKERILALVVEKTGYPADMLALDLDLEADLGVDTVKQAELFAAVRESYGIPREENLKLRDFPTLAHVIQFVRDRRPDLAAPAAAPVPTTAAPAPPVSTADPVKERIVALVVEKTGYPADMLALDLDLEADLGVDTVKQAELFAAVRESYGIPREENLKLRDFPTLAHVIQFVRDRRPDLAAPAAAPVPTTAAPAPPVSTADPVKERIVALVVEKTGYPADMLALDLDLEADLGVDTVKQAELFAAVRESYGIPREENLKLRDFPTLAHVIQFVRDRRPDLAAPASTPAAPAARPAPAVDSLHEKVLEIVAEKTGYPRDMLGLDLDLEADLGIDTVKQAEMFASVRAAFGIPRDENLKLRDFPTLAHVIQFARDRSGAAPAAPVADAPPPAAASLAPLADVPRRVPVPVLRPALELCKSTGVEIGAGSRIVILPDRGGVGLELAARLQARGAEILWLDGQLNAEALKARLMEWMAAGPIQGVYWLPALDPEGDVRAMDFRAWKHALEIRVKWLSHALRTLYDQISAPGTFLISATRLGGQHGYDDAGAASPLGGAVTGFTKAYQRERPDALVKAVDAECDGEAATVAERLLAETLADPGAVEIGYRHGLRWSVGLRELPAADGQPGLTLNRDSVFLVTGAAGSIVAAITADLAAASGGTFYLLDLAPQPDPADADLRRFTTDRDGLKRDFAARMQARGERPTPAAIERELATLERVHAAWTAIQAVEAAGGQAHYYSVNLTDGPAVAAIMQEIRERHGRLDVLLHAAGLERSRFLKDKDPREFDLVFDVKADGWFHLLHAIGDMPLGATVAFSSIAGRFGNGGQTDYSAANDLLCKFASSFRTTRPGTRAISIDWTAWGGIGMATRGSIPKMMELAGIDMLPPEAGVPWIRRELTAGGTRGEVVAAQRLGILEQERDATGGLDLTRPAAAGPMSGPMSGRITGCTSQGVLTIEITLDPKTQPFLYDHQIDGTPVLPGVMGLEAFTEAAAALLPGWHVTVIEEVHFLAPFKFYRHEPRTLTVEAQLWGQGEDIVAECRLVGTRQLAGQAEAQKATHFTARVRVSANTPALEPGSPPPAENGQFADAQSIYQLYFHGPAYQVLERAWKHGSTLVGLMAHGLPANHVPAEQPVLAAPRLIELCFQTAGVWEMGRDGRMGLPQRIRQVELLRPPAEANGRRLVAVVAPNGENGSFEAEVIDSDGHCYVRVKGYHTAALPGGVDTEAVKPLRAIVS